MCWWSFRPNGQTADHPVDRRRLRLFQSAVRIVQAVVWMETKEKGQEHRASCDET